MEPTGYHSIIYYMLKKVVWLCKVQTTFLNPYKFNSGLGIFHILCADPAQINGNGVPTVHGALGGAKYRLRDI